MVMTAFSMLGLSASAAAPQAGDLIKMDGLSSVYYLGNDGKRYVYPSEAVYFSWHKDFSGVVTVSASELQSYPLGSNIVMRPGTKLIKITTDPSVYAVEPNGVLRKIQSEADAIAMFGANWAKRVVDVADAFFTNYTIGTPLAANEVPAGTLVKTADSGTIYYYDGANYRSIANEAAFNANRFDFANVVTVSSAITAGGSAISTSEFAYVPQSKTTGPVVTGSGVTVSLSATTPAANDLPIGTANTMLKFNITAANDGPAVISGVKLSAIGLGTPQNIQKISVYKDNVKLNNTARDIDSNKEAQINFTNAVTIPAGTTATFEVRALISAGTGKHGLSIAKASDVMAGNTVSGSFPVAGNIFTAATVAVGKLTFTDDSALSEVKLGDKGATIAKVKLANDDVENITVKAITFKKDPASSASDSVVENLKLNFDGQEVASAPSISNRYVTFTLNNPITINKSISNKRLTVTADVVDGAGKTIGLVIEAASDVVATGDYYGYQSQIATTLTSRLVTVKAGTVSIEKVNAASDKLRVDVDNQEIGTFKITANSGKNAELSTLRLTITSTNDNIAATSSFTKIENVEVFNKTNNTVYDLSHVSTTTASGVKVYANTSMGLMLTSGVTNELVVRFDTLSTATNEDYTVKIADAANDLIIKETGNDTVIGDITPNTVELKKVAVETAGATFSLNALSSSYTAVIGTSDVEVLNFNVKAAQNSDAYLRDLTIEKESGSLAFSTQTVSAVKLWKGDSLVKTVSSSQIGGGTDLTFTDLSEKVNANDTNTYKVTVSFVKNTDSSTKNIKFALKDASIEASDGKTITPTPTSPWTTLVSARTVAMVGTGSLYVAMDNGDSSTNRDSYQLAGAETGALAALKLKAENETVKVTKLTVEASENLNGLVTELGIYDGSTLVGSTNIIATSSVIEISGDKMIVPMSSKNYYVKAKLSPIGKDQTGTSTADITLKVNNIEATGYNSGESLVNNGADTILGSGEIGYSTDYTAAGITSSAVSTQVSKKMAVVASRISSIDLVGSAGNVSRSLSLTDGQAANAAIISVTAPVSSNTEQNGDSIKTRISQIVVGVATSSKITSYTASIERVNGTAAAVTGTPAATSTTFATLSGADYEVMPGETAYFLVKVVPTFTAAIAGDSSINVSLDDLTTNLTWKDALTASDKTDLRLSTTKVDGVTIKN